MFPGAQDQLVQKDNMNAIGHHHQYQEESREYELFYEDNTLSSKVQQRHSGSMTFEWLDLLPEVKATTQVFNEYIYILTCLYGGGVEHVNTYQYPVWILLQLPLFREIQSVDCTFTLLYFL